MNVAAAIDAGFGVIKFSRHNENGELVFDAFPSIALAADAEANMSFAENMGIRRDIVLVKHEGSRFRVGREIRDHLVPNDLGRDLTDSYYDSPVYHALMKGALLYMGYEVIDSLVLGLPLNHFQNAQRIEKLKAAYTGDIELADGRSVHIKKVDVYPQPFGGYLFLESQFRKINGILKDYPKCGIPELTSGDKIGDLNVLIVDPGEYTLDWLVMTPSGPNMLASSAASDAGRHRVLRDVADVVSRNVGRKLGASILQDIDSTLRTGKTLRIAGVVQNLDDPAIHETIQKSVKDPVSQMFASLRGMDDKIDLIAVIGGSPEAVANEIRNVRPSIPLFCAESTDGQDSSIFANVRGFLIWAKKLATMNKKKAN